MLDQWGLEEKTNTADNADAGRNMAAHILESLEAQLRKKRQAPGPLNPAEVRSQWRWRQGGWELGRITGRIPPLKGSGEAGIQRGVDQEDD
ncbi:hypothetical protein CRENBAI_009673 [Crenichthys baileyi]|uniref:Uncharacterized protein n=1 Tax=Crenichthys baileyi TaxID=28760 RepID=A0AAV9R6B4_9TELE